MDFSYEAEADAAVEEDSSAAAEGGGEEDVPDDNDVEAAAAAIRGSGGGCHQRHFRTRPVDVGEILVAPVPVTYTVKDHPQAEEEKQKMAMIWMVVLRTRKCYSFNHHIQSMIDDLDKEDKSRLQKAAGKDYEEVMNMMREVFLFQYKNSPGVVEHHRRQACTVCCSVFCMSWQPSSVPAAQSTAARRVLSVAPCSVCLGSPHQPLRRRAPPLQPRSVALCYVPSATH
jgi:hypothetical protein